MAVECRPRAIWFVLRVEMEHNPGDMTPVSTFRIRVEQAQIRDDVPALGYPLSIRAKRTGPGVGATGDSRRGRSAPSPA
jgi:hypothetical protein